MPKKQQPPAVPAKARIAKHGQKMIEIRLRFWTDDIAKIDGQVLPKHVWGGGMINIERNEAHGIEPERWIPFNSMAEIPASIEKCMIKHDIKLIASKKMHKYMLIEPPKGKKA